MSVMCDCCGEKNADPKFKTEMQDLCRECATFSNEMEAELAAREKVIDDKASWARATVEQIANLCAEHGWDLSDWNIAQTGSRYAEAFKECDSCILGLNRGCECKTIKIRVADHATAYCSEDVSIVMGGGSGDDHNLSFLEKILAANNESNNS